MKINYSDEPVIKSSNSVFLAGPTPRDDRITSWRPEAVEILKNLGFDGTVYVPERREKFKDYDNQVEWEWEALGNSGCIAFWVPRKLPDMPAFTTNVEFGMWLSDNKTFYGRPDWSENNLYLDKLYKKVKNVDPYKNMHNLLTAVFWYVKINK